SQTVPTIAGTTVTSCVAAQFDVALASATVRMRAVGNACGTPCTDTDCRTGDSAYVFVGPDMNRLHQVGGTVDITGDFADYPVAIQSSDRFVVVCRTTNGFSRDDVEVDAILGKCP